MAAVQAVAALLRPGERSAPAPPLQAANGGKSKVIMLSVDLHSKYVAVTSALLHAANCRSQDPTGCC